MTNAPIDRTATAVTLERDPSLVPETVLILYVLTSDKWNDFGLQVHADVGIRNSFGIFEWVNGFFALKDQPSSRIYISKLLEKRKTAWIPLSDIENSYASMLRNVSGYQLLVRQFGIEKSKQIAISANDAAFYLTNDRTIPGWHDFSRSQQFTRAFMRFSETVFALKNAALVFSGQSLDIEDARQEFEANIKLGSNSLTYKFVFPAEEISENRIAVIIGKNGIGKTATLIALSRKLLDRNSRSGKLYPEPRFNQLLIYAHSGALTRFRASYRNPRAFSQKIFSLDPTKWDKSQFLLTSQFITIARESDHLNSPIQNLVELVEEEFGGLNIWIPVIESRRNGLAIGEEKFERLDTFRYSGEQAWLDKIANIDTNRRPLFLDQNNQQRKLSLGQQVFLGFIFHAISNSGPASIFLIDEPENFLHPNLTSHFVRLLHEVLRRTKSIAILATHSPFVVREVQRSQVHLLTRNNDGLASVVEKPRLQTFGANVSSISDYIFGDDLIEHLYVTLLRQTKTQSSSPENWPDSLKEQLSLDALMLLRKLKMEDPKGD